MDNTVTEGDHRPPIKQCPSVRDNLTGGCGVVVILRLETPLLDNCACSVGNFKMRLNADPFNLSAEEEALSAVCLVEGKLYAR